MEQSDLLRSVVAVLERLGVRYMIASNSTCFDRRRRIDFGGFEAYAAAPEDVIVGKLWYYADGGSDKHLRDIASILKVSGAAVDREAVSRWARELGYAAIWDAVVAKVDGTNSGSGNGPS